MYFSRNFEYFHEARFRTRRNTKFEASPSPGSNAIGMASVRSLRLSLVCQSPPPPSVNGQCHADSERIPSAHFAHRCVPCVAPLLHCACHSLFSAALCLRLARNALPFLLKEIFGQKSRPNIGHNVSAQKGPSDILLNIRSSKHFQLGGNYEKAAKRGRLLVRFGLVLFHYG